MIDIFNMDEKQTIETIEKLRVEVGWSDQDILEIAENHFRTTDSLKDSLAKIAVVPGRIQLLWWNLVGDAPFKILLDNLEDRDGCVLITTHCKLLAVHDQSIGGANWEVPDDMDIAYAMPSDHPDLLESLVDLGYVVDDANYSPPEK